MESAPPVTSSSEVPPPVEAAPPPQTESTAPSVVGPSPPATSSAPSTSTVVDAPAASSGSPSQNPTQNPPPSQPHLQSQQLIQPSPRPTSRPQAPFSHVAHQLPSSSSASAPPTSAAASAASRPLAPSLPSPSTPTSTAPRSGGLAIGVPAHGPHFSRPQQPSMSFSPFGPSRAFSQPFSSLARVPDQSPAANAQGRAPIQSIQQIGMIGSLTTSSQMRPSGPSGSQQQRFSQPTLRSTSTSASQSTQNFPGPTLLGGPSMVSPSSSSAVAQQQISAQGKQNTQAVPSSSYRPQARPHVLQQRPNQLQQHQHSLSTTSHQPQTSSLQQHQQQKSHQPFQLQQQLQQQQVQQHQVSVHQSQEQNPNQQNVSLRNQQTLAAQQPHRPLGPIANRPTAPALVQSGAAQSGPIVPTVNADAAESGNRVISKRSIHELVNQIDPSEKLDADVEEVLMDIAEDFIESVTSFACSLAKHRKSSMLESKDILLHVEKCWNMTLPGFGGDEIKTFKKQMTNDIHKERLAMIKKSMATGDGGNTRNPTAGQSAANSKAHAQPKAPVIGSPKT